MPSASPAAQARRLFFSHLNNNTSSHSLFSVPLSLFLQIPTRRSRRAGGGALRLARLGGIFALGLAAKVGASVYTPIRGASSSAASAASAAASGGSRAYSPTRSSSTATRTTRTLPSCWARSC